MYKRPIQAHQIWWCTASIPLPHYFRRAQTLMHLWFRVCIQLLSIFFFMYIVDYVPWCTFIICQFCFFFCFCLIMCNISEYQNRFTVKTLFSVWCCYCWKDKKNIDMAYAFRRFRHAIVSAYVCYICYERDETIT